MRTSRSSVVSVLCILLSVPVLSGCGLVFGGTRQVIHTTSSPDGVAVVAGPGVTQHRTPTALSLERGRNYALTFSAPGYKSRTLEVRRSIRGGIVVLDIVLGLVPVIVDAATGAWYRLSPEVAYVSLEKADAYAEGPDRIDVSVELTHTGAGPGARVESSSPGVTVDIRAR